MIVERISIIDGKAYRMDVPVTEAQLAELESPNRRMIQEIFPDLSAGEREFLISGITPEKWAEMFPAGEED